MPGNPHQYHRWFDPAGDRRQARCKVPVCGSLGEEHITNKSIGLAEQEARGADQGREPFQAFGGWSVWIGDNSPGWRDAVCERGSRAWATFRIADRVCTTRFLHGVEHQRGDRPARPSTGSGSRNAKTSGRTERTGPEVMITVVRIGNADNHG